MAGRYLPGGSFFVDEEVFDAAADGNRRSIIICLLAVITLALAFGCIFVGSSRMTIGECFEALLKKGTAAQIRIIWNIRIPRTFAAVIAGAGLSISGLLMQTNLNNPMASPSTLGVSNAAVFGANLSIIAFAGGFLSTGNNLSDYTAGAKRFQRSYGGGRAVKAFRKISGSDCGNFR